jgi:hypothetical protein
MYLTTRSLVTVLTELSRLLFPKSTLSITSSLHFIVLLKVSTSPTEIEKQIQLHFTGRKFEAVGLPTESRDLSYSELNWLLMSKRDGICSVNKSFYINNTFYLMILTSFALS